MGQLTDKGFQVKTQNEYFNEEKALYEEIDPLWNLDPSTPDGLKIAHDAEVFTALDEQVKLAYDARDPNKASGQDLDVLRALTGAKRSLGTPSTVGLKLTGVAGTSIRQGAKVKDSLGNIFLTDEDVTIGLDGTATVNAHNSVNGAVVVSANTLTNIVETVGGWQTVTNPLPSVAGTDRDSDAVFRIKSAQAVGRAGQNQRESLFGELYETTGVRKVAIYENKTGSDTVDPVKNPHALPAHSLAIIVDGGTDEDVAEAIYRKISVGVNLYAKANKVQKTVYSKLFPASYDVITFARPVDVAVKISVKIADPKGVLPVDSDVATMVKQAFIDYYEGDLLPSGIGFLTTGFSIGESVPYSRLFTPVNKVLGDYPGTYVSELKVNDGTANVNVEFNELARFTADQITVTVEK